MRAADFIVPVVRSITGTTGALIGGLGVASPILAGVIYEFKFGRPSSTSAVAIPIAVVVGLFGAAVGAAVGMLIRIAVDRSRWSGRRDRRVMTAVVLLSVLTPVIRSIASVRSREASNRPHVVRTSGGVFQSQGPSAFKPLRSGRLLWVSSGSVGSSVQELRWNDEPVSVEITAGTLVIHDRFAAPVTVDLSHYDYARAVYGVTVTPPAGEAEWLALLIHLRATGRRDYLVILDPQGGVVHEELLERLPGPSPSVGIGVAGSPDGPEEVVVNRGRPLRYGVVP